MAQFSIGQIEKITGVKSHILRYWEDSLPVFAPKREYSGRRVYSLKDVELIMRMKYLVYTRKFTVEGACAQIVRDAKGIRGNEEAVIEIRKIRGELSELFFELAEIRAACKNKKSETADE
jgi:hypothetical protein